MELKGAVIKLGSNFSYTKLINKNTIEVGASTLDRKVASFAKDKNLTNFEFLSCIPGSIGGAVVMNSGCYENDISQILHSIKVVDINKMEEKEIQKDEIDFYYRGTIYQVIWLFYLLHWKDWLAQKIKWKKTLIL